MGNMNKNINNIISLGFAACSLITGCSLSWKDTLRRNVNSFEQNRALNPSVGGGDDFDGLQRISKLHEENAYLKGWPPATGLAVSGGGTRSASFSIGVLRALSETDNLKHIKVISAVSGGAYATYWYFTKEFYKDQLKEKFPNLGNPPLYDTKDIFQVRLKGVSNLNSPNNYRFQKYLEESSEFLKYQHTDSFVDYPVNTLTLMTQVGIQTLSLPIHWVANWLFDWEINVTPQTYFYKDAIERTYGYVPLDYSSEYFANARPNTLGFKNIDAAPLSMNDIRNFLEKRKEAMPYFIINATVRYGRSFSQYGNQKRTMENSRFEFTPWGCYSQLLKDTECPSDLQIFPRDFLKTDIDFSRQIAFSGAAVDAQLQSVDSGGEIHGPKWWQLEPVLDVLNLNQGHYVSNTKADNIHFWIHKILPWPLYVADDWLWVREDSTPSYYLSDGGHSENLGAFALIRRGVRNIIIIDAEQDGRSTFSSAKLLAKYIKKYKMDFQLNGEPIDVFDTPISKALMFGCIKRDGMPPINVKYIKLSMGLPSDHGEDDLPFSVRQYKEQHPDFPQESTTDVSYSPQQFRAYRDLGYEIAFRYFKDHKVDEPQGCRQLPTARLNEN